MDYKKIEEGKIYKIIKTNGNELVGFAYHPKTIDKLLNKLMFSNVVVYLSPVKIFKAISKETVEQLFNWGTLLADKEIDKIIKLEE